MPKVCPTKIVLEKKLKSVINFRYSFFKFIPKALENFVIYHTIYKIFLKILKLINIYILTIFTDKFSIYNFVHIVLTKYFKYKKGGCWIHFSVNAISFSVINKSILMLYICILPRFFLFCILVYPFYSLKFIIIVVSKSFGVL